MEINDRIKMPHSWKVVGPEVTGYGSTPTSTMEDYERKLKIHKSLTKYMLVVRSTGEAYKHGSKAQNAYQSLGRARRVAKDAVHGEVTYQGKTLEEATNYFKIVELTPSGVEFDVM